jgi:uncharacterized protein (DUF885 family)
MKVIKLLTLSTIIAFSSCKNDKVKTSTLDSKEDITQMSAKANAYFETKYNEDLKYSPMQQTMLGHKTNYGEWDDISPKADSDNLERTKKALQFVNDSINESLLDDDTKLSYTLFKQKLENEIADYKYRLYDYPVNQMHGMQAEIPAFLINMHTVENKADAEAYISRLNGMLPLFNQLVDNLKERDVAGITPPKFVFNHVIKDSKNLIKGAPFTK